MKNFKELDAWIKENPKTDAKSGLVYLMSRYDALVHHFGQKKADGIMRSLEVASWGGEIGQMLSRGTR